MICRLHRFGVVRTQPPAGVAARLDNVKRATGGWFSWLKALMTLPDYRECCDNVDDMEFGFEPLDLERH